MNRIQAEGLILENREYRERDAIVVMATPNGCLKFFARGIQREGSKNRRLCIPFTKVCLELNEGKDGSLQLIQGTFSEDYSRISEDLSRQAVCLAVNEAVLHSEYDRGLYMRLEMLWQACRQNGTEWIGRACLVLTAILRLNGISPQVDACVVCGRTSGITALDLDTAGFLCDRHSRGRPVWNRDRLIRMRRAVKVPYGKENLVSLQDFTLDDVLFFTKWYTHYSHSDLHAVPFLETVRRMGSSSDSV